VSAVEPPDLHQHLLLLALGDIDSGDVEWLAGELAERFGLDAAVAAPWAVRAAWRAADGACDADAVLQALQALEPDAWRLAVTDHDLRAAARPWVFGAALLGGCCAVVSTARLGASRARLLVEAVHELGHLAGLDHCNRTECAMAPSDSVLSIDRKAADFCPECLAALARSVGSRRP
jgi:predicted Zn-dependent protease